jgi:hypothetical protein
MRLFTVILVCALGVALAGCAMVVSPVGNGILYTGVQGPVDSGVSSNATKTGKSCAQNFLGLIAWGDASISTAKVKGTISSVSSVDHDSFSFLILYSRYCTIVRGE